MTGERTVLVAGASGLIGHAALEQFSAAGGFEMVGVSRSLPSDLAGVRLLALDLTDAAACRRVLGELKGVTHLVYAALQEGPGLLPGWYEEELMQRNASMLRNVLDSLDLGTMQHVSLLQGTKAYGVHHPSVDRERVPLPLARARAARRTSELLLVAGGRAAGAPSRRHLVVDDLPPDGRVRRDRARQHEPTPGDRRVRRVATSRR